MSHKAVKSRSSSKPQLKSIRKCSCETETEPTRMHCLCKECQKPSRPTPPCPTPPTPQMPFLMGRAIVTIPNNTAIKDINYQIVGTLSCQFEQNRGIFIPHESGFYQFFYYVTFQAIQTSNGNITVQVDGERRMRLIRSFSGSNSSSSFGGNTSEAGFIGQYQYVPNAMLIPASSRQGTLTNQFSTMMSTAATLSMNCGDAVQLSVYQNNTGIQNPPPNITLPSGPIPITAFIEFTIIKIAEAPCVPSSAVQSVSPLQFSLPSLNMNNVLLQQSPLAIQSTIPMNASVNGGF